MRWYSVFQMHSRPYWITVVTRPSSPTHYQSFPQTCPVFKCHLCGKSYESRTGLNYHNTSSHVGEAGSQTTVSPGGRVRDQDQEMERNVRKEDTPTKSWTGGLSGELGGPPTSAPRPPPPSPPVRLKPGPKPGHKHLHKNKQNPGSRIRQSVVTPPQSPPIVKRRGPGRRPKHLHVTEDVSPVSPAPVSSTGLGPPASTADVLVAEGSSVKKITITIPSIVYPVRETGRVGEESMEKRKKGEKVQSMIRCMVSVSSV